MPFGVLLKQRTLGYGTRSEKLTLGYGGRTEKSTLTYGDIVNLTPLVMVIGLQLTMLRGGAG